MDTDGSFDRTPPAVGEHSDTVTGSSNERFFAGLEGLRGLAVVAVLFFHGGFGWARGGFLGVSTFFTLSGFLITSNVLRSAFSQGGLDLRTFWLRRFRRLMPAALAAILLASIYTILAGDPSQRQSFFGDATSSLLYVANWHLIYSGQAYADLFAQPSALLHFWSLAIAFLITSTAPLPALDFAADEAALMRETAENSNDQLGPWDAGKHRFPGTDEWLHPGDEAYDRVLESEVLSSSDFLASKGCRPLWLTSVPTAAGKNGSNAELAAHPEWQLAMNEVVKRAVAKRKGTVGIVDFAEWYASTPRADATNRPDGIHFVEQSATALSDAWLSKAIFDEATRLQRR